MGCGGSAGAERPSAVRAVPDGITQDRPDEPDTWATRTHQAEASKAVERVLAITGADQLESENTDWSVEDIAASPGMREEDIEVVAEESVVFGSGSLVPIVPCRSVTPVVVDTDVVRPASSKENARWSGPGGGGNLAAAPGVSKQPMAACPLLPKQQLNEAARLAETRRRFDNQRYQQQVSQQPGRDDRKADVTEKPPGSQTGGWDPPSPDGPRLVGLALNTGAAEPQSAQSLPGGIEDVQEGVPVQSRERQWLGASKRSFDADEEALMEEILDDFGTR